MAIMRLRNPLFFVDPDSRMPSIRTDSLKYY